MVFCGDCDNFISGEVQFNSVLPTPNALCRCVAYISLGNRYNEHHVAFISGQSLVLS